MFIFVYRMNDKDVDDENVLIQNLSGVSSLSLNFFSLLIFFPLFKKREKEREKERERDTHTDRQIDRQR